MASRRIVYVCWYNRAGVREAVALCRLDRAVWVPAWKAAIEDVLINPKSDSATKDAVYLSVPGLDSEAAGERFGDLGGTFYDLINGYGRDIGDPEHMMMMIGLAVRCVKSPELTKLLRGMAVRSIANGSFTLPDLTRVQLRGVGRADGDLMMEVAYIGQACAHFIISSKLFNNMGSTIEASLAKCGADLYTPLTF
jgi:hypothetical protein